METSKQKHPSPNVTTLSNLEETSIFPGAHIEDSQSSSSFVVVGQENRGRRRHGKQSHNKRGPNFRLPAIKSILTSSLISDRSYRLAEAATETGLTAQYILNLITRHKVITPQKTLDEKHHEIYMFTSSDVNKLRKTKMLTDQGRPIREGAEMVRSDQDFAQVGQKFLDALVAWKDKPDDESWDDLVDAISMIPTLDEFEKDALFRVEGLGDNLIDTAAHLKLRSIRELTDLLDSAYEKVGRSIFYLLLQPGLEKMGN